MRINYDDDCNHNDYHDFGGCNAMVVDIIDMATAMKIMICIVCIICIAY